MKKILCFIVFFVFQGMHSQSYFQKFKDLSSPKKTWVIFHPFKARKAFNVTNEAKKFIDSIAKTKILGIRGTGTRFDAFRHSFWMAYLGQNIGINAAKSLGEAHEKENFLYYQENKLEDGSLPDKPSMEMDLHNNEVGLSLINKNIKYSKKELFKKVINAIDNGEALLLKRNHKNRYVTCSGKLISKDSLRIWDNKKCLIKSNSI